MRKSIFNKGDNSEVIFEKMLHEYGLAVASFQGIAGLANLYLSALDEMGWYMKDGILYRPNHTVYEKGTMVDPEWTMQQLTRTTLDDSNS